VMNDSTKTASCSTSSPWKSSEKVIESETIIGAFL
jgi:hypothetical protein